MTDATSETLHIAIIGSGSGAFACAIRAAELGARVTMVERGEVIGGTCVNVGCVPSKIMIRTAQLAHDRRHVPFEGLNTAEADIDPLRLMQQRERRVAELRQSKYQRIIDEQDAITLLRGEAWFDGPKSLTVRTDHGDQHIAPDRILIASGASPAIPSIKGLPGTPFWTSTQAMRSGECPPRLIVIGGSVVAVEQAQAFARLGSQVTMLVRSRLLSSEDPALGDGLCAYLRGEGIDVCLDTTASSIAHDGALFTVNVGDEALVAERLLIATGRRPNTEVLRLGAAGVESDRTGAILVDERLRTSAPDIYATGDCTTLPQFVYVAAAGGTRAAGAMHGIASTLDLSAMPAVIFTDPQVATVGLSETQAEQQGLEVDSRRLEMDQVPRALANFDERGFIKLVIDAESRVLIGAQILAPEAGEIIQIAALAISQRLTVEQLAGMLFPYLVYAEAIKLCAQTFQRDVSQLSCCAG